MDPEPGMPVPRRYAATLESSLWTSALGQRTADCLLLPRLGATKPE